MTSNMLEQIDKQALGLLLQEARKKSGLTQAEAAELIGAARTTLVAIEKGERKLKPQELILLARGYGRDVSDFVRADVVSDSQSKSSYIRIKPFEIQFRAALKRSMVEEEKIQRVIFEFEALCQKYQELERLCQSPLLRNDPPEYHVDYLSIEMAAESIALSERQRLGLGDGPIPFLRDILEQNVGLRIFYIPMPSGFSEIYLYDEQLGGCLAINSNHPEERRRWSMAHGYLHFLAHRRKAVVDPVMSRYQRLPASEQLAEAFPAYFLMPTSSLLQRFREVSKAHQGQFTPTHLFNMAHYYGVSLEALALRLEQMKLLRTGLWDSLRDRGLKVRQTQQELGIGEVQQRSDAVPVHYQHLAIQALGAGQITEGRFADFLGVDRLDARRIAQNLREKCSETMLQECTTLDLKTI